MTSALAVTEVEKNCFVVSTAWGGKPIDELSIDFRTYIVTPMDKKRLRFVESFFESAQGPWS
ncbi:hypothetical protein CI1B_27450 [Bradyrhizobium ivorense]|uniref:Uncharacterized protein n=1 Tax=Bradyrhizobium ivorense TaxID=2511166 RepID=A0A508T3S6_9BRAD|nr:hypothetical protein [Bradyrhizobium ivorense]VIO69539.1 hypothetical protein CI1B_27450 [Bradyrhizobium ivorense]VIO71284.1 hypothetical protein CI41S_29550 [Bradyrhizobium ivorense]